MSPVAPGTLDDRVAVVTGAGRGLGRAVALALAEAGAHVALAARSQDQLEAVAAEVEQRGRQGLVVPTDVTSSTGARALARRTYDEFGRLDVLVNNAGVLRRAALVDMTDDDWNAVIATNLQGTFNCTRAVGPYLIEAGAGKVITISSSFAFKAVPDLSAYCSTKAALVQFTRVVALEWVRHGIQVNAVAPGYFATELNEDVRADDRTRERILRAIPARRMGEPQELGPLIVYLASGASDYMTGQTIVIDGGMATR
jgi:NAD(P)-dependent dehydrogenase (short-subunit alcohol dehydrogenase family)